MSGIVVALTIGFLLGILLMVLLASGQEEEKLLERVEQVETSRNLRTNGPEHQTESVQQTEGVGGSVRNVEHRTGNVE